MISKQFKTPEDRGSAEYERIYKTVDAIVDTRRVPGTPKWIIHKIHDDRIYFGINIWRGPIYEPFIVPEDRHIFHDAMTE